MAEPCKGITKDGSPCPIRLNRSYVTPGYCLGHDPGITKEMRQSFTKGFGLPGDQARASFRRRLRTPDEIMAYVEDLIEKWEAGPGAALTVETIDCLANLLRIQLGAIKEKGGSKKEKKALGFRVAT
jgi:hypothetical protein